MCECTCVCVHVWCLVPSSNAVFGDKGTADVGNDENNLFVSPQAKVECGDYKCLK